MFPRLFSVSISARLSAVILMGLGVFTVQAAPPIFSSKPTDEEILTVRVFREPLAKTSAAISSAENKDLAKAILNYADRKTPEDVSALTEYLVKHPDSAWAASLYTNLGLIYYDAGYFSKAIESWQHGWNAAKAETDKGARRIADRSVAELIRMYARLGRMDQLTALLAEIQSRPIVGGTGNIIEHAKEGLWLMQNRPGVAFRCGPFAVENILRSRSGLTNATTEKIHAMQSTQAGTSLAQVAQLAKDVGLDYQPAKRLGGNADIIIPAVINWKVGHYAALVGEQNGRYKIVDPTFGDELLVSRDAIDAESSGYFLVPSGALPSGWQAVEGAEAATVWGKGQTTGTDPKASTPCDKKSSSGCGSCGSKGMATYSVHALLASLSIMDTPVGYTPPIGPAVDFTVTYSQRDIGQASGQNYSNLGPQWTHDWFSYVQINSGTADVYVRGGGSNSYMNFDSGTQAYSAKIKSGAVLVKVDASTYEERHTSGAKEVFGLSDGSGRFYLSSIVDAQGNSVSLTYDAQYRLTTITDALGQVTTLAYQFASDPLKITKVTDPFGRFATFEYFADGKLKKITDTVGLTSEFTYATSSTDINSLITAYGTTTFSAGTNGLIRWLEVTDPQGDKERTEFRDYTSELQGSEPYVPSSVGITNQYLYYRNTFYWDKKAMAEGYPDVRAAHIYHWLHDDSMSGRILESEKLPYETRKWYIYAVNTGSSVGYTGISMIPGMDRSPCTVAQVIPDASGAPVDQISQFTYDVNGNLLSATDPLGRKTSYLYDANGIDLLEVRQATGATSYDVLSASTYNAQHRSLTTVDMAGQATTYTYNSAGQLSSVTNPKGEVIHYYYNPLGDPAGSRLGDGSRNPAAIGYLVAVDGPLAGSADTVTMAYDTAGRVHIVTDPEGYAVTAEYDNLNRLTKRTYPDGTYEQTTYDKLDVGQERDRLGRITINTHNAIRQLVQVQDPMNRITHFEWCKCGALLRLTDPLGHATTWWHNVQGQLTAKFYPDGSKVSYTYETVAAGNGVAVAATSRLKTVTDAMGQTTNYTYYLDGRLKQVSYGNAIVATPSVSYTYDPIYPRLTGMTDGTGTTGYGYYPAGVLGAGQVSGVTNPLPNSAIALVYDQLGRLTSRSINGSANTLTTAYDATGRVIGMTNPLGSFTYGYVPNTFRVDALTYPNGQVSHYSYYPNTGTSVGNGDHRLQEIQHLTAEGAPLSDFGYTYDAKGTIQSWSQQAAAATAAVHTYAYDNVDQLTGDTVTTGGTVQATYGYAYDAAGNRSREQVNTVTNYAAHNVNNQRTGLSPSGGTTTMHFAGMVDTPSTVTVNGVAATSGAATSFAADVPLAAGASTVAVTATTATGASTTQSYRVSVGDAGTDTSFTYDLNGNMLTVTGGTMFPRAYTWDAANRLVSITQGANVTTFVYDGFGRRVAEKLNGVLLRQWVWCEAAQPCEERDATNGVTKRFYTQGEQIGGAVYYYTKDHQGSIREMTDSAGAVRARYNYDPYGRRTKVAGDLEADFGFTGHYYHAASGLSLALYRAYDSNTARWLSRDPLRNAEMSQGLNLYAYVRNSPANYTDADGQCANLIAGGIGMVAGGISGGVMAYVTGQDVLSGVASGAVGGLVGGLTLNPALGAAVSGAMSGALTAASNNACPEQILGAAVVGGAFGYAGGIMSGKIIGPVTQNPIVGGALDGVIGGLVGTGSDGLIGIMTGNH